MTPQQIILVEQSISDIGCDTGNAVVVRELAERIYLEAQRDATAKTKSACIKLCNDLREMMKGSGWHRHADEILEDVAARMAYIGGKDL